MKKIIHIFIISIFFGFIFSINTYANSNGNQIYEAINLVYNDNFTISNYFNGPNYIRLTFTIESDVFIENEYLQGSYDDIKDNTFMFLVNFQTGISNSLIRDIQDITVTGNKLTAKVTILKERFVYYYQEIIGTDDEIFFNNFLDYIDDLANYFKLYVRIGYKDTPNINKNIYETIDLVYDDNFTVVDTNEVYNRMEVSIVIKDDRFIDYKYKDDIFNNSFFVIDYSTAGYRIPSYHYIWNAEIIGDELRGTVNIVKSNFDYYIEEIAKTDKETFYNNFRAAIQYDLYKYFKLYLRIDKDYTYMGFRDYIVTENLKDRGALTSLYDVYISINTPHNLVSDVKLYFKQDISAKLQTPLNRNSNSYEILDFEYSLAYYRWRIHLNIALSNTLLEMYDNDADYIIRKLMIVYVGVMPSQEYNIGYSDGYNDGLTDGEQFGWNDGYNIGHEKGYNKGYFEGFDDGYSQGHEVGYEEGSQISQGEAYEQGYKAGYNESFIGTMDKWLVPSIVIVMFVGGFFAIARTKRDGDI